MAREYIVMETAMIGLLSPWVFLFFQNRIYMEAAKRMVKKPIVGGLQIQRSACYFIFECRSMIVLTEENRLHEERYQ